MPQPNDEFVQSLARGLAVIEVFDAAKPALTLADVARATGFPRATARRLLHTLVTLGYASFDGKLFRLTPRVLQVGYAYIASLNIWQAAQPFMIELVEQVHESCSAAVLEGHAIVYVARVPTAKRIMSINLNVGTRLPAHVTSMGRVLMAALKESELDQFIASIVPLQAYTEHSITDPEQLRETLRQTAAQGWSLVDQELETGVRSLAVPLTDSSNRVIAALNIGAHSSRVSTVEMEQRFLPPLQHAARQISAAIAASQGRTQ